MKDCRLLSQKCVIFLLIQLLAATCNGLLAADRVALVIGNNNYPLDGNLGALKNCVNDAKLVARALEQVGFEVMLHHDLTKGQMDDALLSFEIKIGKDGEAVVYFAGHGIEFDNKNYLLGTNARLKARSRLGEESLNMETFAKAMLDAGARASFLFLDCCREAPPADWLTRGIKKRGLADIKIAGDIIISYAASPGEAANDEPLLKSSEILSTNSPYAQVLASLIPLGLKHTDFMDEMRRDVFRLTGGRQRTWESGSFLNPYYFSTPKALKVEDSHEGEPTTFRPNKVVLHNKGFLATLIQEAQGKWSSIPANAQIHLTISLLLGLWLLSMLVAKTIATNRLHAIHRKFMSLQCLGGGQDDALKELAKAERLLSSKCWWQRFFIPWWGFSISEWIAVSKLWQQLGAQRQAIDLLNQARKHARDGQDWVDLAVEFAAYWPRDQKSTLDFQVAAGRMAQECSKRARDAFRQESSAKHIALAKLARFYYRDNLLAADHEHIAKQLASRGL